MATILQPSRRNGTVESPYTPTDRQNFLTVSVLIDPADIAGIGEVSLELKVEQSADGVLWWPLGGMGCRDVAEALNGTDRLGNPRILSLSLTEQIYRADVFRNQRFAEFGGFAHELKRASDGAHYYQMALCPQIRVRTITNRSLRYGLDLTTLQRDPPPTPLGRRSASLLGTFAAAESATSPVTSGSRTTTSGSLIVGQGAAWRSISGFALTISDDKSNTYTELFEISASSGAGSFGWGVLAYNLAGTRGASHEVILTSGADSCCVGGLEFDGVDSFDTSGTEADGSGTAPSCTVTPTTGTALVVGLMIHDNVGPTVAVNVGTLGLEVDENNDRQCNFTNYRVAQASGGAITTSWTLSGSGTWAARSAAFTEIPSTTWEQEGFRFYDDDGDEDASTALADQDVGITRAADTNTRLRLLLNTDVVDPDSETIRLEYKEDSESDEFWRTVGTAINNYPSVVSSVGLSMLSNDPAVTFPGTYTPLEGDVIVLFFASTTVLGVVANSSLPSGWVNPLGDGAEILSDSHGMGCLYHVVTSGEETAVTLTYQALNALDATETGYVHGIAIRYADPTNIIDGFNSAQDSGNTTTPHVLAGVTGSGVLLDNGLVVSSVAKDATGDYGTGAPTGWTRLLNSNSSLGMWTGTRDSRTTLNTNVDATDITPSGGDEYCSITLVIGAVATILPKINLAASTHITASGENTTARLTAPSGKTTADFGGGRIQDDEATADTVDLAIDDYGEWEWCLTADSDEVEDGQVYQFRATRAGTVLNTYTVTPEWEIGAGSSPQTATALVAGVTVSSIAPTAAGASTATATTGAAAVTVAAIQPVWTAVYTATAGTADATVSAVAPAVTGAGTATATADTATVSVSAIAPAVTGAGTATATAGTAAVTVSAVSPTATGASVATATAGVADVTVSVTQPVWTAAYTVTAGTAGVTVSAISPTATATGSATATADVASVTVSATSPGVSGAGTSVAGVAGVNVSAVSPTATGASVATAAAGTAAVTVSAASPAATATGAVSLTAGAADVTVSAIAPATAAAGTAVAGVAGVSVSAISPTAAGASTATATAGTAAVSVSATSPTVSGAATVTAGTAGVTVSATQPVWSASYTATAGVAGVSVSAVPPAASGSGTATVVAGVAAVTVTVISPAVIGAAPAVIMTVTGLASSAFTITGFASPAIATTGSTSAAITIRGINGMAVRQDIHAPFRGAAVQINFTIRTITGAVVDLTGKRVVFQLLTEHSDDATPPTPLVELDNEEIGGITIDDPETGAGVIVVPSAETDIAPATYAYTITCPDAGGEDGYIWGDFDIPRQRVGIPAP